MTTSLVANKSFIFPYIPLLLLLVSLVKTYLMVSAFHLNSCIGTVYYYLVFCVLFCDFSTKCFYRFSSLVHIFFIPNAGIVITKDTITLS